MRGSFFLACGSIADRGLAFVRNMILTRLLLPEAMGIMVILLSLIAFFEVITDVGIKISVIQNKQGAKPVFLNTAWWFQSIRGIGLYVAGFMLAPWVFWFFFGGKVEVLRLHPQEELILMMRTMFLVVLFNSLISPASFVLEKELKFSKLLFLNQGSAILGTITTVLLCFWLRNAWAMVWGNVITAALRTVLSFGFCPFLPRFAFEKESFRELTGFAGKMFGLSLLTYLAFNIDILFLGRFVSAEKVGFYGMAATLASVPRDLFGRIINPVLLPAFSEKQDQNQTLSKIILRITRYTSLFGLLWVPVAFIFGDTILSIVYGSDYAGADWAFGFFCCTVFVVLHSMIQANLLLAKGLPEKHRFFTLLRVLLIVILVYPLVVQYGIAGAALTLLIANAAAFLVQIKLIKRLVGFSEKAYWQTWLPGLFGGGIVTVIALCIRTMTGWSDVVQLSAAAAVSMLIMLYWIYAEFVNFKGVSANG